MKDITIKLKIEFIAERCPMLLEEENKLICYGYGTSCKFKQKENCSDYQEYRMRR